MDNEKLLKKLEKQRKNLNNKSIKTFNEFIKIQNQLNELDLLTKEIEGGKNNG